MTDKELKKLKRADLLELLIQQSRQLEAQKAEAAEHESVLRAEIQSLKDQLEARELQVSNAGSIAEAALSVNGIMEAAQKAADQYIESVRAQSEDTEHYIATRQAECKQICDEMLAEAEAECAAMRTETDRQCEAAMAAAGDKIYGYWADISAKLESMYTAHESLQQLLGARGVTELTSMDNMERVLLSRSAAQRVPA